MNPKNNLPSLWGMVVISILFFITFVVLIFSQPGAAVDGYQELYKEYTRVYQAYQSSESELMQVKPGYVSQIPPIVVEQAYSEWSKAAPFILILVLGTSAIITMGIILAQIKQNMKRVGSYYEQEMRKKYDEGRKDNLVSIATELISDKDVMSDLAIWLMEYDSGIAKMDKAAYVHRQILDRLMKQIRLFPLTKVWQEVIYDPDQHMNYENLKRGEKAIVVEPGWRVGTEVIKLPVVKRKQ